MSYRQHVLWTLRKGQQVAEARTWMDVTGPVLGLFIDGRELWHERKPHGAGVALGELSEQARLEMEGDGWRL